MIDWVMLTTAMVATAVLTWIVLKFYRHRQWLDEPVARSAHNRPMPSSGGVAMIVTFACGVLIYLSRDVLTLREALLFIGCLPLAIVGLVDDLKTVDFRWRLVVQFASALYVVILAGKLPGIPLGPWVLDFPALIQVLAVLAFVWFINLYNFMDGIDGLAASEAIIVTLLSSVLVINSQDHGILVISFLLASVTLGFLVWNWQPASIFMGDVGSNFLAYIVGALAIVSIANGSMNPWSWLLLLGIFVVDATYTLLYRIMDRQPWHIAHNCHAYQYCARMLNSHQAVTLLIVMVNLLWLAPLAWVTVRNPELGLYLTVLGYLPLVFVARKLRAGIPVTGPADSL